MQRCSIHTASVSGFLQETDCGGLNGLSVGGREAPGKGSDVYETTWGQLEHSGQKDETAVTEA